MNLWVVRNPASRAEALMMSSVANGFISTKTSVPVNGQVQDSVIGSYELTRSEVKIDKYHAMALFANTGLEPPSFDRYPAGHLFSGRDIVSILLNETPIDYERAPSSFNDLYAPYIQYDPNEIYTVIENGVLTKGVLDKKSIGAKAMGGVFHLISREYGQQKALDMIFALQQIVLQFILYKGFTVGPADLLTSVSAVNKIRELVATALLEARVITDRLVEGEVVPPIGNTVHEFYEKLQINALKVNEHEMLREILGSMTPGTNGFFRMIATGAKGTNPNLIHVVGNIGQTTINGERIRELFAFRRTMPYFPRFSTDPFAYGFVEHSYMHGMGMSEFIFQGMNGRFDLINKALSTAKTGYFMRKGVMNNQSSVVDNFRRVTKDTKIVQLLYGEDGLDPRSLEKVVFHTVRYSDEELRNSTWIDLADVPGDAKEREVSQEAVENACRRIKADRDEFRRIFGRIESINFGQEFSLAVPMPVNVYRFIVKVRRNAEKMDDGEGGAGSSLSCKILHQRIEEVAKLCANLPYTLINELQERRQSPVPRFIREASWLLSMQVRAELSPRVLASLSDKQIAFITDSIRMQYSMALVDYGSAVGILAAQAISEPLTQYMLDSHHRSVAEGTNKSGLIRVEEIYKAKPVEAERSSSMQLPLISFPGISLSFAQETANAIEYLSLYRFVDSYEVLLESINSLKYPPYLGDRAWIESFYKAHPLIHPPNDLTHWCFRLVLDKMNMVLKAVDLELIVQRLRARHPSSFIIHTPESSPEIIIRIWLKSNAFRANRVPATEEGALILMQNFLDSPIRGILGVRRAQAVKIKRSVLAGDGSLIEEERFAISTVGTNLYGASLQPAIDSSSAISSSIGETYKILGVEAACTKIVSETRAFMEGNTPNLRHLYLYAYEMTRTGRVTSIESGGLNIREHDNVLLRMANANPVGVVREAALVGAKNNIYGLAGPHLLGAIPRIGTLYNSVVINEKFLRQNVQSVDAMLDAL